jgi:hypothetical protein
MLMAIAIVISVVREPEHEASVMVSECNLIVTIR